MINSSSKFIWAVAVLGVISALATVIVTGGTAPLNQMMAKRTVSSDVGNSVSYGQAGMMAEVATVKTAPGDSIMMYQPGIAPPYYQTDDALNVNQRAYEKSAQFSLVVSDVSKYIRQIKEYFLSIEGRVLYSNLGNDSKIQYAYLTVKVPVTKFEEAQNRVLNDTKKIISESINAQDVTGQIVGQSTRVDELKKQRADREVELAAATTELARKRIEALIANIDLQIKQAQQQLDSTETRTEYATINISVSNEEKYFRGFSGMSGTNTPWDEFSKAWSSIKIILGVLIRVLIWTIVYSILWIPIALVVKFIGKMRQPKS